jgi:hypothetical protein
MGCQTTQVNIMAEDYAATFKKVCKNVPHNTNRVYCEIELKKSNCTVYLPLRNNLLANASKAKAFYQDLADKAGF